MEIGEIVEKIGFPVANAPKRRTDGYDGKFVQVNIKDYMLLSFGHGFHKDVFSKILDNFGIDYDLEMSFMDRIPVSKGQGAYELVGAGKYKFLDEKAKKVGIWGISADYEIGINFPQFRKSSEYFKGKGFEFYLLGPKGKRILQEI